MMFRCKMGARALFFSFVALCAVTFALVLDSCAKPPTAEMEDARAAVARAENDSDVPNYAAAALTRARNSLTNMQAEADAKRYDNARNMAIEAKTSAEKAISDAKAAKERSRQEAETALNALQDAVVETDNVIKQGKSGKLAVDWAQVDGDFERAQDTAAEAENANAESRYRDAAERASAARIAFSAITSQVSQASIAVTRKK